jgi:hypothetical protein
MNRVLLAQLLAKALAYLGCGKLKEANLNAKALIAELRALGLDV